MTYPSARDWLFSVKTFAASMLALYIGLAMQLPRPYWAMATVYIVSNPFVGATRSKALYRALGTIIGAAAAVFFVPPFVEFPYLFSLIVALWTGTLLYMAIQDRTARSYVFMLAGYTLPLIALPAVSDPTAVFDLAVARTEEILLGIICASVVGSTIFPSRLAPTITERTDAWFRDAAFYAKETLSGRLAGKSISASRQRLAATVNGLEFLLSQLAYDHTRPDILARARVLRGRMELLLPLMSALADPLSALLASRNAKPSLLQPLLADIAEWFEHPRDDAAAQTDELRARITQLEPGAEAFTTWDGALLSNTLWRLRQVVDIWQDCHTLRTIIAQGHGHWRPHFRHWRLGGRQRYADRGIQLFAAGSAVAAIFIAACIWISSGWQDGAAAVSLAAVACCFFAALDEPAPQLYAFFVWTCASVVLAGLYLFLILPNVHDFPMLVIIFAAPFILVGTLMPRPRFSLGTMIVAVNTASFVSLQGAYEANFLTFLNSNFAGVAGLLFAFIWTRVTRPFGAELAARRIMRASWADVALSASSQVIENQRNLSSLMVDRLMQLIPRLAATDDHRHPSIESFRDLRVALNSLDLRRLRHKLDGDLPTAIDRLLDDVRAHFRNCIDHGERQPVPARLKRDIDSAFQNLRLQGAANGDAQAATATPAARHLRNALHALVGLRLSLFPEPSGVVAPGAQPAPLAPEPSA